MRLTWFDQPRRHCVTRNDILRLIPGRRCPSIVRWCDIREDDKREIPCFLPIPLLYDALITRTRVDSIETFELRIGLSTRIGEWFPRSLEDRTDRMISIDS